MHLSIGRHSLILFYFLSFSLIHNCAKDSSKKMLEEKLKKGRTLVSILHTNHFFRQGHFGEEFVVTAQLRSLATKPIKHIILEVHIFDEAGTTIASRREAVSWKKDNRLEKRKKYGNLKRKGWLLPGKTNVCEIVFYAVQIEPEHPREKRKRTLNKKFRRPRKANFTTIFPAKYRITVHSAVQEGDRKER